MKGDMDLMCHDCLQIFVHKFWSVCVPKEVTLDSLEGVCW